MKALKDPVRDSTSLREQALAGLPVSERHLGLAGIGTPVLEGGREGGKGPPVILLHGPAGHAAHWMSVIPLLVDSHRVIAPDLPGHGASDVGGVPLDAGRVLSWLDALIAHTCDSPPVLVGQLLGGAIAARYASENGARLQHLVLVDTFGLCPFRPLPEFGRAIETFLAAPSRDTHEALWGYCAFDLARLHRRMAGRWAPFEAYNVERAAAVRDAVMVLMQQFAFPGIPADVLASIGVPTSLVWGRYDRATPLAVAEGASRRFGWPLRVIDHCADDPPIERPGALARALCKFIEN